MLSLNLKVGEFITLEGLAHKPVAVQVVELRGGKIRLGVVGPLSVTVLRGEVVARNTGKTPQEVLQEVISENKREQ